VWAAAGGAETRRETKKKKEKCNCGIEKMDQGEAETGNERKIIKRRDEQS
jgi:hypothetical protein